MADIGEMLLLLHSERNAKQQAQNEILGVPLSPAIFKLKSRYTHTPLRLNNILLNQLMFQTRTTSSLVSTWFMRAYSSLGNDDVIWKSDLCEDIYGVIEA